MRGKVFMSQFSGSEIRITPAYAGKSTKYEYGERELGDHPRLCGEKFQTFFCKIYVPGSPPPMRGKGLCGEAGECIDRITPAYAGKRSW